jgi:FG-GAP repeat
MALTLTKPLIFTSLLVCSLVAEAQVAEFASMESLAEVSIVIFGETSNDEAGSAIAGAGDVNGDGLGDLLVGAWANDEAGEHAGKVYLILGRTEPLESGISLSEASASFLGEAAGDFAGYAVAGAGDVNGDGLDDFLIGAIGNDEGEESSGKVYLILGRSDADWGHGFELATADASFIGDREFANMGFSLASAGDWNGDQLDDLLIASPNQSGSANRRAWEGAAYLVLGRREGWFTSQSLTSAEVVIRGDQQGDLAGFSIAGGEDLNGDGLDDIMIGVPGYDSTSDQDVGMAAIFFGQREMLASLRSVSEADLVFVGDTPYGRAGNSVAMLRDLNGDGLADVAIGAPRCGSTPSHNRHWGGFGNVLLVFGSGPEWRGQHSLGDAQATCVGVHESEQAGTSLCAVEDLSGDGLSDLIISSHGPGRLGSSGRVVYLLTGGEIGWGHATPLSENTVSFVAEQLGDKAGSGLAQLGDFNGDGRDDFAIGASYGSRAARRAGQVYLVLTPPHWNPSPHDPQTISERLMLIQRSGDLEEAVDLLRSVLQESPDDVEGLFALIDLASPFIDQELMTDTWTYVMGLCFDENSPALWSLARTGLARQDLTLADALRIAQVNVWDATHVARWLYGERHDEETLAIWDYSLSLEEHEEFHFGRFRSLMRLGRHLEAQGAAAAGLALAPDYAWGHLYLGDAMEAQHRTEEAESHWEACLASQRGTGAHSYARQRLGFPEPESTP